MFCQVLKQYKKLKPRQRCVVVGAWFSLLPSVHDAVVDEGDRLVVIRRRGRVLHGTSRVDRRRLVLVPRIQTGGRGDHDREIARGAHLLVDDDHGGGETGGVVRARVGGADHDEVGQSRVGGEDEAGEVELPGVHLEGVVGRRRAGLVDEAVVELRDLGIRGRRHGEGDGDQREGQETLQHHAHTPCVEGTSNDRPCSIILENIVTQYKYL